MLESTRSTSRSSRILLTPERRSELNLNYTVVIDFVRHGKTRNNRRDLLTGSQDIGLIGEGIEDTKRLARQMNDHYDMAWSSTLKRSKSTLSLLLRAGVESKEVYHDPRLNERSRGIKEGSPRSSVSEPNDLDYSPPGGESYLSLTDRCYDFLYDLFEMLRVRPTPSKVLICSHAGPIRVMYAILRGIETFDKVKHLEVKNSKVLRIKTRHLGIPRFIHNTPPK